MAGSGKKPTPASRRAYGAPANKPLARNFANAYPKGRPTKKEWAIGPIAAEKKIILALARGQLSDYPVRTKEERSLLIHHVQSRPDVIRAAIAYRENHPRASWVEAWIQSLRSNGNRHPGKRSPAP